MSPMIGSDSSKDSIRGPLHPLALCGEVEGQVQRFLLRRGTNRIGSLPTSEIHLQARGVSKRHAILVVRTRRSSVEDLASKNGTFVNGQPVGTQRLRLGDEIQIGTAKLRVEQVTPEEGELAIRFDAPTPSSSGSRETSVLKNARRSRGSTRTPSRQTTAEPPTRPEGLIFPAGYLPGRSLAMTNVHRQMAAVARSTLPILILGETGVGKEGIARSLHASSDRHTGPYIPLNCAAIPTELLEAELFGIVKGVATGVSARPGTFERAQGGTLFLDEVGDMPLKVQAKLLRALQEKEISPLGGSSQPSDVRIVAATNTDVEQLLASGAFRRDLYYRLAGLVLSIPPLRHRSEDIAPLIEHFLKRFSMEANRWISGITVGALRHLVERDWVGNIRELEHTIRRLVYLCPNHQAIDSELCRLAAPSPVPIPTSDPMVTKPGTPEVGPEAVDEPDTFDLLALSNLDLKTIEHRVVHEAMRRAKGNKTRAAKLLGLSREALRRRWKRLKGPLK